MSAKILPLHVDLGDGLVMRTARGEQDITAIAESHRQAFDEELYVITMDCLLKFPGIRRDDIILVEDTTKDIVVSSLCLLPVRWAYEDVTLAVAELGIVGTRKEYQRRGLVRQQMEIFERRLHEHPYHLAVIQGIPYFYRQFGYEYAVPLGHACHLELKQIPALKKGEQEVATVRPMTEADIPQALNLCAASSRSLCLHEMRDQDDWLYPERLSESHPDRIQSYLVEQSGKAIGYFRLRHKEKDGQRIPCREMSDMGYDATVAAFRFMKGHAQRECAENGIDLKGPASSTAVRVAKYLGAHERVPYAWQIRIPDRIRFLQRIAPVLERRLANSMMAGLTQTLCLNFYEESVELAFEHGRIARVASIGMTDDGGIRVPPYPAIRLLTCYQSYEEIAAYRLDCRIKSEFRAIMDILFPKQESHVHSLL